LQATTSFNQVKRYKGLGWYQGWKARIFRRPLPVISDEDLIYVVSQLDEELEGELGYDLRKLATEQATSPNLFDPCAKLTSGADS
jgi:hypothetical protein